MAVQRTTRLDLFTVPAASVAGAVARMALDRRRLRRAAPLFWKLLGTGDGRTFDARDADLRRWGVLTVWPSVADAEEFAAGSRTIAGWQRLADEHWWTHLCTLRSSGRWSGAQPFGPSSAVSDPAAPIAALTRAKLRWSRAPRFWRAVDAVTADLARVEGLRLRLGVGEAPLGLQGTFSLWDSPTAMQAFAYRGAPHRAVIRRSTDERWYAEELFVRFAIVDSGGTIFGRDPLGGA